MTRLELFVTVNMHGSMPSYINREIVIPASLRVTQPLYFMQLQELCTFDKVGSDAKMLGQLLMDEIR